MAGSDEVNSHPRENNDAPRVNITGAELQALIDNVVTRALDRHHGELRLSSIPYKFQYHVSIGSLHDHTGTKTNSSLYWGSTPQIKASVKASRPTTFRSAADLSLSLTLDVVRNKAAKASKDGKRKREDEDSHRSDKKTKRNSEDKKSSGFKKDSQQSDKTHANDTTIVSLRISEDVLQTMINAAVGKAVKKANSSYMAGSDEVNSHPRENNDAPRVNITGAELQALIDNAVTQALDRQYDESSDIHSKTLSVARSKPLSKSHETKEDDVRNSSKQRSVPSRQNSSYMAGSDEVNSHPRENNDAPRVNITGAELQALIDNAVTQALDRQYDESSDTHSKTLSVARSKPLSKSHETKEDDVRNSSKQRSVPSRQVVLHREAPVKTFRNKAAKASEDGKRKREDEDSHRSDKKTRRNSEDKKSFGFKKDSQRSGNK
ncbi:nucleolin 2-like [Helianthus annuus]|uniref:nucleolin 2-like n=1 Tax=Helianthus annuus TaxID=4232 RepID=UPI000B909BB3|nr:nucleolin 2-like [Helianthus annuus]